MKWSLWLVDYMFSGPGFLEWWVIVSGPEFEWMGQKSGPWRARAGGAPIMVGPDNVHEGFKRDEYIDACHSTLTEHIWFNRNNLQRLLGNGVTLGHRRVA